jgi:hypothetical protein
MWMHVSRTQGLNLNDDPSADVHFDISDKDLENPEYLKELNALEGEDMTDEDLEAMLGKLGFDEVRLLPNRFFLPLSVHIASSFKTG